MQRHDCLPPSWSPICFVACRRDGYHATSDGMGHYRPPQPLAYDVHLQLSGKSITCRPVETHKRRKFLNAHLGPATSIWRPCHKGVRVNELAAATVRDRHVPISSKHSTTHRQPISWKRRCLPYSIGWRMAKLTSPASTWSILFTFEQAEYVCRRLISNSTATLQNQNAYSSRRCQRNAINGYANDFLPHG